MYVGVEIKKTLKCVNRDGIKLKMLENVKKREGAGMGFGVDAVSPDSDIFVLVSITFSRFSLRLRLEAKSVKKNVSTSLEYRWREVATR